ncbi:MAG: MBL fold metallo-hydrolase [Phototrophicaceae bacterium]|jgi:L-ascorbate metabolism protein UlaG (beta-lactamase superfamily)
MIDCIDWLGYGSFLIRGARNIYINPWRISQRPVPADIILISHDHHEHYSPADIAKLRTPQTTIITNQRVAEEIEGAMVLRAWQSVAFDGVNVKAVPAYSTRSTLHRPEEGGLGFVISMKFYDIYYAGDTEIIPEMERIHPDIAILPIDGNGTLSIDDAVTVTQRLHPRWVMPSNWGTRLPGATPLDILKLRDAIGTMSEVVVPVNNGAYRG